MLSNADSMILVIDAVLRPSQMSFGKSKKNCAPASVIIAGRPQRRGLPVEVGRRRSEVPPGTADWQVRRGEHLLGTKWDPGVPGVLVGKA